MLISLDVEQCPLTVASIETFKKMRSLKTIRISDTGWAPAQQRQLEQAVAPNQCKVLWKESISKEDLKLPAL